MVQVNVQNGGFAAALCYGTDSQASSETNVMKPCPLNAGESYHVYYALDLDGNGGGAFIGEALTFAVPSVLGVVAVRSPSTEGFNVDYEVFTPFVVPDTPETGKIYFSLFDGTPTTTEVVESSHACRAQAPQTSGEQSLDVLCTGALFGGETYNLWTAIDSDGQGADPQLWTNGAVAFTLSSPTIFVKKYLQPSTAGVTVSYMVLNANPNGLFYYGVALVGLAEPSVSDVMTGSLDCSGNVSQTDATQQQTVELDCTLVAGETYRLWAATTIDTNGNGSTLAHSSSSRLTFDVPTTVMVGTPSTANEVYSGLDFTYTLGNPSVGSSFSYSLRLRDDPIPTNQVEIEAGTCPGTIPVEDDQQHIQTIDCKLMANTRYRFDYLVGAVVGSVYFTSAEPVLYLTTDFSATTTEWFLRYRMENPAWNGGSIYWGVAPDGFLAQIPHIIGTFVSQDMVCIGTFPQEDEDSKEKSITACTLSGGSTYRVFVALDTENTGEDQIFSDPPMSTFTIPAPTVSTSVSDGTVNGYTLNYDVTNPMQGGKIYFRLVSSAHDVPSVNSLLNIQSNGPGCAGTVAQGTGSVSISCTISTDKTYTLWIVADIPASSPQIESGDSITVTMFPSVSPSRQPSVPFYDCSPDRIASLQGTCFSLNFTCETCCSTTTNWELCWPAGSDFEDERDFCCGAVPISANQTIIISDGGGRRRI